jgi:hypothetical protein
MVVVIVVAGLNGGERWSRGSTGDSSDLFLRGTVGAGASPESGLSPLLQGLFSVLALLVLLPLPLSRLSTLSTSRLCHELFP